MDLRTDEVEKCVGKRVFHVCNGYDLQPEMCEAKVFQTTPLFICRLVSPKVQHESREIENDLGYFTRRMKVLESNRCGWEQKTFR